MSTRTFKVAVVGCGAIVGNHLSALAELGNVQVTALCDTESVKAEAARKKYSLCSKIYTDFEKMLESEELDAIHICTPHHLHAPMAIAALERGLNVFLEKPMCISAEEIDALLECERRSSGKICVCFQNRFNATTALAKKLIAEDGGAQSAYATVVWGRDEKYYTESSWRGKQATEGGGVLINQAIHSLDLLVEFLGKPDHLFASTANHHLKGIIEVEDSSEGMIVFKSGKCGNYYATTSFLASDRTNIFIKTKNHSIEIINSDIYVDKIRQTVQVSESTQVGKACYGKGHYTVIRAFYDALECGGEMPVSLESAQWAVRILLAAYKSGDEKIKI